MRIKVNRSRCAGHAMCAIKGGEDLYPLDDDGFSIADGVLVPADRHHDAMLGARICPERAITLVDEASGAALDLD